MFNTSAPSVVSLIPDCQQTESHCNAYQETRNALNLKLNLNIAAYSSSLWLCKMFSYAGVISQHYTNELCNFSHFVMVFAQHLAGWSSGSPTDGIMGLMAGGDLCGVSICLWRLANRRSWQIGHKRIYLTVLLSFCQLLGWSAQWSATSGWQPHAVHVGRNFSLQK